MAALEQFGLRQRWALNLRAAPWWYRDQVYHALLKDRSLRDAFAFVVRGDDPNTVELVRLTTGPISTNEPPDFSNVELELWEVP